MLHLYLVWDRVGSEEMITVDTTKMTFLKDPYKHNHMLADKALRLILTTRLIWLNVTCGFAKFYKEKHKRESWL